MEQLKVTDFDLTQMCRLCLSSDVSKAGAFLFSSVLGKKIADIIMECVPVQITRHDKMPTYICQLCFTQLKKFHQFQMQAVRSDKTLQSYVQQLSDYHPQIKVELALEEQSNSVNQKSNADVTAKCEFSEISDEFDTCYSKQKVLANFSTVNKTNEIFLKSEIKDEPMDDNSLIPAECADAAETSVCDDSEINCEDSMIEIGETKVGVDTPGNFECSLKFENGMTEKISVKSEETFIPLKEVDISLCPENIKNVEDLRSNECNLNTTEHPSKLQNFNEKKDFSKILKKSATTIGRKSYQCEICQKCFRQSSHLQTHKLKHTGEKPHQCDICKRRFKHVISLKYHKLKHTGEKPYKCDICEKYFRQSSHLQTHKLKHTGEKPYRCDICKMCFRTTGHLYHHNLIHTGEKPYQCDICKMCFKRVDNLKSHKLKHTGEKPYQCDICKVCYRLAISLKLHKLKHTGEKPYQCDICKVCFRQACHLQAHKLKHTGEKPYQCDICKMCFRQAGHLQTHKFKHTAEKPHQCDICKMCFKRADNLKSHKLKHTGEKPYKCDICQMCFTRAGNLQTHKLKHTGEKPYKCDVCKVDFRQAGHLQTHKLRHTEEKPHQCDICKMCFRTTSNLQTHKLRHTRE